MLLIKKQAGQLYITDSVIEGFHCIFEQLSLFRTVEIAPNIAAQKEISCHIKLFRHQCKYFTKIFLKINRQSNYPVRFLVFGGRRRRRMRYFFERAPTSRLI